MALIHLAQLALISLVLDTLLLWVAYTDLFSAGPSRED